MTLDDLAKMIKDGGDFVVYDAKTGEDITRSVLTQIIVEQEQKGQNLLPISFLRQLIGFYGDSMQFLVPGYLEQAMMAFARNQEQMRDSLRATFGIFPFGQFEEMGKQNIALFERALKMLSPYAREAEPAASDAARSQGRDDRRRRIRACTASRPRSRRCASSSRRSAATEGRLKGWGSRSARLGGELGAGDGHRGDRGRAVAAQSHGRSSDGRPK